MYNSVDLFYEPQKILNEKTNGEIAEYSEMTDFQQAFLCGLIREKKPRKILEVGVAAGGTTAVILNCVNMVNAGDSCEMYSLDISDRWYRDDSKETGFVVKEHEENIIGSVKH